MHASNMFEHIAYKKVWYAQDDSLSLGFKGFSSHLGVVPNFSHASIYICICRIVDVWKRVYKGPSHDTKNGKQI